MIQNSHPEKEEREGTVRPCDKVVRAQLVALREMPGWSNNVLARKLGVNVSMVSQYLNERGCIYPGDVLKFEGKITQIAAALAGFCHESIRRPSVDQVLKIYHLFKTEMNFVIANRSKTPGLRSAGVLAGFAFALSSEDGDVWKRNCAAMLKALMLGEDPKEGSPLKMFPAVAQLHEFLTGEKAKLILASMNRGIADLTLQAVYADLNGNGGEKLKMQMDGRNYFCLKVKQTQKVAALFTLPK